DFDAEDRRLCLQELADVARDYKSFLGPGVQSEEPSSQLQRLVAELPREVVEFSPLLAVVAIREKLFSKLGLDLPPYMAELFRRFNFYLVQIPITVVPKRGGGFVHLECIVEFNPDLPPAERPTAYQVFPNEEWQDVVRAWQSVEVGIDETL